MCIRDRHEALDFTPWLSQDDNIALLADAVGLDITVDETESSCGHTVRRSFISSNLLKFTILFFLIPTTAAAAAVSCLLISVQVLFCYIRSWLHLYPVRS